MRMESVVKGLYTHKGLSQSVLYWSERACIYTLGSVNPLLSPICISDFNLYGSLIWEIGVKSPGFLSTLQVAIENEGQKDHRIQ